MAQPATLFVCALCKFPSPAPGVSDPTGGQHLIDELTACLGADQDEITIQPVRCMAACDRACNAALSAPGKLTFIFNGLSPQAAAPELAEFCRQYVEATGGKVAYGLRSPAIKKSTAYVLPPLVAGEVEAVTAR